MKTLRKSVCLHDIRREPGRRRQAAESFAGDPDRQRHGSFADADRVVIVTNAQGAGQSRVERLALQRLLSGGGVNEDIAADLVDELLTGHAVVLVEVAEILPRDVHALLDMLEQAA